MDNFLVTGCAGFIGFHMCEYLLNKKKKVYGLDNYITGSKSNVKTLKNYKNFIFKEHDLNNEVVLNDPIDYIIHLASPASPVDFYKYPIEILKVGSIGSFNILNFALKNNSRILFSSTSEVYGDPLINPQSENYSGNVKTTSPRAVYDESKRFSETLFLSYKKLYGLPVRIARIFNTYGERMRVDDGRVIPNLINQLIKKNKFTVYGSGNQTRSFCYISDTVEALYRLLMSDYYLPVNIGSDFEISINSLVQKINLLEKYDLEIEFHKLPEDDPKVRMADITLAKNILSWQPEVSIETGLKKTYEFYKNIYQKISSNYTDN